MGRNGYSAERFHDHFRVWWNCKDWPREALEAAETAEEIAERDRIIASIDESEVWLLAHRPSSEIEAICILEVMRYVMQGGGRSSGEDLVAAANIQSWLARQLDPEDVDVVAPHRDLIREFGAPG